MTLPSRRDPTVRTVAAAWRALTSGERAARNGPGEPTIIACSGGGDSSALVLALAVAAGRHAPKLLTIAHIVHDLRPPSQRLADRDRAAELARTLGLPFVEASVAIKSLPGNAEANARHARYDALRELAAENKVRFIATAHNSHDQAESVIMAILRGAGPRGLSGIAASRKLPARLTLIRPMLGVSPSEARELCTRSGWVWTHDQTNDDPTRLRNAIRADILPRLLKLRPGAESRIASAAERCKEAADAIGRRAKTLLAAGQADGGYSWLRSRLRRVPPAVLGEVMRRAASTIGGPGTLDALTSRAVTGAVRLICSADTDPKSLRWGGGAGVTIRVDAHTVTVTPARRLTS